MVVGTGAEAQRAARTGSFSAPTSLCCGQGAPVLLLRGTRSACILSVRRAGPVLGSHVEALDLWLPTKPHVTITSKVSQR